MKANPCTVCGGTDLNLVDGFYYCVECGTQDETVRETLIETTQLADGTFALKAKRKVTKAKEDKDGVKMSGEWYKWHTFNFILLGLTEQLEKLGAGPDFKMKVLWVWTRYIKEFQVKEELVDILGDKEETNSKDSGSDDDHCLNNNNKDRKKKPKEKIFFAKRIKTVTKAVLLSILYAALNLSRSDLQLSHLLKYVNSEALSFFDWRKLIPEELSLRDIPNFLSFSSYGASHIVRSGIKDITMSIFKTLGLGTPLVPDLRKMIDNYVIELCLPDDFKEIVFSLMNYVPCDHLGNLTKDVLLVPDFECVAMSYVLVALKMVFGLDCDYEIKLSDVADQINMRENHVRCYKIGMSVNESTRLFSFREWCRYLCFRKVMLSKFHLPFAKQFDIDFNDYVFMEQSDRKQTRKIDLLDEVTMDILKKIPTEDTPPVIPLTQFPPTVTPMSTYTDIILEYIQDTESKFLLSEDFTKYSLKYVLEDIELPAEVNEIVQNSLSECNKSVNRSVNHTIRSRKVDMNMVFVKFCENKNWLKTKPPTIDHITVGQTDAECIEAATNNGEVNIDDSVVDVSESLDKETELNSKDDVHDLNETSSRYGQSLIFPEEDPKSGIHDLNITDSYHNRHNSDNTSVEVSSVLESLTSKDEDVRVVSDLNLLREEDIDKNIFDDTFADIKDDKNEVLNDMNDIENTGINNIDDSGINNTVFEFGIPNGDISQHNRSFVVESSNLSVAKFDPYTFNRENVVKELVISECKKYNIVVPDAFKEGYKKIRDKKVKLLHVGAGEEAPKRSAKRLIPAGDTRNEVEKLLEAYNLQLQNDVIEEVSQNVRSLVQDLENRYNELNELTEDIKDEEHIDKENIKDKTIDKLDNELDCEQTETLENVSEDDIEIRDDEQSLSGDPKFDENTHDIRQLYLKFEKEFGIDEVIKIDDVMTEKILLKGIHNKHDEPTTIEELPVIDSETHESEPEVNGVDLDESPMFQEIEDQSLEELEPLIKDSERFKNSKYWCRHYIGRLMTMSSRTEEICKDFEFYKNCSRSFNFVMFECAAVLDTSAFNLYREMQLLERAIIARCKHGDVSNLLLETESTSELSGLPEGCPPPRPPYGSVADQDKTDTALSLEPKGNHSQCQRAVASHDDRGWYPKQKIRRSKDKSTRPKRFDSALSLEDQPLSQRMWSRKKKCYSLVSQDRGIVLKEKRSRKKIPNSVVRQDEGTVPEVDQSISQTADSPVTQDRGTAPKRKRSRKKKLDSDEGAVPEALGQRADSALDHDKGTAPTRKRSRKKKPESMVSQDKGTALKRSRKKKSEDIVSHDEGTLPKGIQSPSQMAASAASQMSQDELIIPERIQSPSQTAASTLSQDEGTVPAENQSLTQMTDSVLGHDKGTVPKRKRSRNKKSGSVVIQDESTVQEGIQSPSYRADSNLRQISQDDGTVPHETHSLSQGADSAVSQDKLTAPKRKRCRKKKSHSAMSQDEYTVLTGIQSLSLSANSVTDSGEAPSQVSHHEALKRNRSVRQMSDSEPSQDEGNVRKRKPSLNQWADSATRPCKDTLVSVFSPEEGTVPKRKSSPSERPDSESSSDEDIVPKQKRSLSQEADSVTRPYEGTLDSGAGYFNNAVPKLGPQKQSIDSVSTPVEGTVLKWIQSHNQRADSARSPDEGSVSKRRRPRKRVFDSVSSQGEDSLPRRRRSLSQRTESARSPGSKPSPDRKRLREQSQPNPLWSKEGKSVRSQDRNTEPSLIQPADSVASRDECTAKRSQPVEIAGSRWIVKLMRMAIKDIQTTDSVAIVDHDNEPSLKQRADSVTSHDDCTAKRSQPAERGRPKKIVQVTRMALKKTKKDEIDSITEIISDESESIADSNSTAIKSESVPDTNSNADETESITDIISIPDETDSDTISVAYETNSDTISVAYETNSDTISVAYETNSDTISVAYDSDSVADIKSIADETDSDTISVAYDSDSVADIKSIADETDSDTISVADDSDSVADIKFIADESESIVRVNQTETTQPTNRGRQKKNATTLPAKRGRPPKKATNQPAKRGRPKKVKRGPPRNIVKDTRIAPTQPPQRSRPPKNATSQPAKRGRPKKNETKQPVKSGLPRMVVKLTRINVAKLMLKGHNESVEDNSMFIASSNSVAENIDSITDTNSSTDKGGSITDINSTADKGETVADTKSIADKSKSVAQTNFIANKSESIGEITDNADKSESIADTNSTADNSESDADTNSLEDECESIADTNSTADKSECVADTKSIADKSESIADINSTAGNCESDADTNSTADKSESIADTNSTADKSESIAGNTSIADKSQCVADTNSIADKSDPVEDTNPTADKNESIADNNSYADKSESIADESEFEEDTNSIVVKSESIADTNSIADKNDSIADTNSITDKSESIVVSNTTADKSESIADNISIADKSESVADIDSISVKIEPIDDTDSITDKAEPVADNNPTANENDSIRNIFKKIKLSLLHMQTS